MRHIPDGGSAHTMEAKQATQPTKSKRNYGVDLLRVFAILCVVLLHEGSHGGLIGATTGVHHNAVMLVMACAYCAVDCFVIIGGFCQVDLRFKSKRILSLWATALFYSVAVTIFMLFYNATALPELPFLRMFLPVLTNCWWFFTAYFGLMLVSPLINLVFKHLDERKIKTLFALCLIAFCVAPFIAGTDIFRFNSGYSFGWFVVLYVIGACIRKINPFENWHKRWLIVYAICVACCWIMATYGNGAGIQPALIPDHPWQWLSYLSPFILVSSIALLMFFSRLNIQGKALTSIIAFLTPSVFAVYLISDHELIRNEFMKGGPAFAASLHTSEMILVMLGIAAGVFVICTLIDKLRALVFKLFKVDNGILALGKRIDERLGI